MRSSDRRRSCISEFIMDIVSVLHRNRFIVSELIAYMFVRHCLLASWRRWTCRATGRAAALVVASPTLLQTCMEQILHAECIRAENRCCIDIQFLVCRCSPLAKILCRTSVSAFVPSPLARPFLLLAQP